MHKVMFQHCPKEANDVAQELAKSIYLSKEYIVWDGDP
jgi:hypothetical protein